MDRGSDTETGVLLPSGCRVTHGTGANVKTRFESLPLIMHELHAGGLGGGRARGFYGQFGFIPFAADFRLPRHVHIAKSGEAGGGELVAERILVVNGVGLALLWHLYDHVALVYSAGIQWSMRCVPVARSWFGS